MLKDRNSFPQLFQTNYAACLTAVKGKLFRFKAYVLCKHVQVLRVFEVEICNTESKMLQRGKLDPQPLPGFRPWTHW